MLHTSGTIAPAASYEAEKQLLAGITNALAVVGEHGLDPRILADKVLCEVVLTPEAVTLATQIMDRQFIRPATWREVTTAAQSHPFGSCMTAEYPSLAQLAEAVRRRDIVSLHRWFRYCRNPDTMEQTALMNLIQVYRDQVRAELGLTDHAHAGCVALTPRES